MQITFIAYGTRGDVQPMLALGRNLAARGHRVRLLASPHFKPWIEQHGLTAVPASVDVQALMTSELGNEWAEIGNQPLKQMRVMRKLLDAHGPTMIQDAWQGSQGSDLIVSSFTSMNYAPTLAGARHARHVIALLQPPTLASRSGEATLNAPLPRRDSWINYLYGRWLMESVGWQLYGAAINRFRRETLHVAPQTQSENTADWKRAPILLGFSAQVVPPPADWPPNVYTTGYWFLDDDADWTPPQPLLDFLQAGEPPVCIGFGSMAGRSRDRFTQLLVEAVSQGGRRAVLLAGWAGLGDAALPANVLALESAPHGWLFPRAAAVVHHGGAGTSAAAFRAGVPQVIVPHMADQPFWGQRVERLGVGPRAIPRPRLTVENLSAAMRAAATEAGMRQRAVDLSDRIRAEDGVTTAVTLIERAGESVA